MRIAGSGALVVGGASGLGEATARTLAARGAFVRADVTDAAQLEAAVARAAEAPGGLRISVHCAGIGWAERTVTSRGAHALEPFERVIAVNLVGTFNALRLAAAAMAGNEHRRRGRARYLREHRRGHPPRRRAAHGAEVAPPGGQDSAARPGRDAR